MPPSNLVIFQQDDATKVNENFYVWFKGGYKNPAPLQNMLLDAFYGLIVLFSVAFFGGHLFKSFLVYDKILV